MHQPVHLHYNKSPKELKARKIGQERFRTEVLQHNDEKLQFELYYHVNKGLFGVERFFLPNRGDDPYFGRNLQDCISWIEMQYNVKIIGVEDTN